MASPVSPPSDAEATRAENLLRNTAMGAAAERKEEEGDRRRGRPGCPAYEDGVLVPGEVAAVVVVAAPEPAREEEDCGRERLKRHRVAMAGHKLLKDWIDCAAIDRTLVPNGLLSAREALAEECRRANSSGFPIESRCLSA
ncbi:unnamed protein product [Spirodela intermedia]|uniref:Uncharacterized protein n=1 Tax=Spirodela intermedia TaxID=51605 RepID=A0A7I8IS97_SPIIN|nr:unnamed protein product [Spirodela intermedia]CAA6660656.1 unnamed protein product [Spirodela intermedia]